MRIHRLLTPVLAAGLCAFSGAHSSTTPEFTQRAKHVVVYDGPEIKAHLEYWWADDYLSTSNLMLKLSLMVGGTQSTEVRREGIAVLSPDGSTIPLVDPMEFQRQYPDLISALDLNNAWGPPLEAFSGIRKNCGRWFLTRPGNFRDQPILTVIPGYYCSGLLVFAVPGGVRPGEWVLIIGLEEGDVRIPFTLGE
jgi:hypothetical protein